MALATGGISQLSPGAGRTIHALWPDLNSITGAVRTNGMVRPSAASIAGITATVTQGVPPATTLQRYKGHRCWGFSSAAGGAGTALWFDFLINPAQDQTRFTLGADDRSVTEVRFLLAFDRPGGDLGDSLDLGVGISPGTNNQNIFNPAVGAVYRAGAQFGPGGPGKIRFRSRPGQTTVGPPPYATGLGFDTGNVALAGFDEREWHWYAIRIVGASIAGNGICKALIDGVEVSRFDMSVAGNIFPDPTAGQGGLSGHKLGFSNNSNGTFDKLYAARGSLILAPDEVSIG